MRARRDGMGVYVSVYQKSEEITNSKQMPWTYRETLFGDVSKKRQRERGRDIGS